MLSHEGSERRFSHNAKLAISLSAIAGAINATGFMVIGSYTSHVTGLASRFGDELVLGQFETSMQAILLMVFFLLGAITAGAIVFAVQNLGRSRFALAFLLEAAVLTAFVYLAMTHPHPMGKVLLFMTGLLCFAMGLQNALVTNISGAVIRTTHLTGVVTDLGIEISRLVVLFRRTFKAHPFSEVVAIFGEHGVLHPELHKAWLHLSIILSFLAGAVVGPLLFINYSYHSMFAPVAALLTLVVFDLTRGTGAELKLFRKRLAVLDDPFAPVNEPPATPARTTEKELIP